MSIQGHLNTMTFTYVFRQKFHQFYRDDLPSTLNAIIEVMNDTEKLPETSRSTLHSLLYEVRFLYYTRGDRSFLSERDDIIKKKFTR